MSAVRSGRSMTSSSSALRAYLMKPAFDSDLTAASFRSDPRSYALPVTFTGQARLQLMPDTADSLHLESIQIPFQGGLFDRVLGPWRTTDYNSCKSPLPAAWISRDSGARRTLAIQECATRSSNCPGFDCNTSRIRDWQNGTRPRRTVLNRSGRTAAVCSIAWRRCARVPVAQDARQSISTARISWRTNGILPPFGSTAHGWSRHQHLHGVS